MPSSPEEFIISKYLKEIRSNQNNNQKKSVDKNNSQVSKIKNINYQEIMQKNPYGSIIERQYKGLNLSLVSLNFQKI